MKLFVIHLLLCLILFTDYYYDNKCYLKKFYSGHKKAKWTYQLNKRLSRKSFKIPAQDRAFIYSITTGNKRSLKKTPIYTKIKKAQLFHLLTPSGLHLSSLLLLIYFLIRRKKYRHRFILLISPLLFMQNGFEAAKRVLGLKLINQTGCGTKKAFYISFALAFLIKPGLSFLLSYFFLGILILNPFKTLLSQLSFLGMAQMIIAVFFEQPFYIYSLIINPIASAYISLIFPWITLLAIFPHLYQMTSGVLLRPFYFIVNWIELSPRLF